MNYGALVPMGGGLIIGNYLSAGVKPNFLLGYSSFNKAQENIKSYFSDVKFYNTDNDKDKKEFLGSDFSKNIDFISCVCPCSGLSTANVHFNPDAKQNDWMVNTAEFALKELKPKVLMGENSVLLVGNTGRKVVSRLIEVAKKYGYSFSTYKTSTIFHGLPQNRKRSFYFFWKSKFAPIMDFYDKPHSTFEETLENTDKSSKYYGIEVNPDIKNHPSILFLKEFFGAKWRDKVYELEGGIKPKKVISMTKVFENNINLADQYLCWLQKNNFNDEYDLIKNRVLKNKRFWDEHPYLQNYSIGAISYRLLTCLLHPVEDRSLNVRETMDLMGYPDDFEVINKNYLALTQSVPITTSRDITDEVIKFIGGKIQLFTECYLHQDNMKKTNIAWSKLLEDGTK